MLCACHICQWDWCRNHTSFMERSAECSGAELGGLHPFPPRVNFISVKRKTLPLCQSCSSIHSFPLVMLLAVVQRNQCSGGFGSLLLEINKISVLSPLPNTCPLPPSGHPKELFFNKNWRKYYICLFIHIDLCLACVITPPILKTTTNNLCCR